MQSKSEKIILGHKIKRLRQDLNISQLEMAQELNISASYLNLIENNQRPITVNLLFKLGQLYNIDFKEFTEDETGKLSVELNEIFLDPVFKSSDITKRDIKNLAQTSPVIGNAIIKLFETYLKLKEETNHNADPQSLKLTPFESIRSFLDNSKNYFPTLEQASMSIRAKSNINDAANIYFKLCKYVEDKLKTQIKVLPKSIMENLFSRYDPHRGRILISEALDIANKSFQIASQIALIEFDDLINEIIIKSDFKSPDEKYLLKMSLANYFGLSLIMPYDEFKSSAVELRYDLEILSARFSTNIEHVCQRLTTLNKRTNLGVPFFYFKFDEAGNIHSRLFSKDMNFPKNPGANPDWSVHQIFKNPGSTLVQVSELEGGKKFINISKTIKRSLVNINETSPLFSIILGCEIRYMENLVYADTLLQNKVQKVSKIHIGCRLCGMNVCEHKKNETDLATLLDPNIRYNGLFEFNN